MGIDLVSQYLNGPFKDVQGWCIPHLWNVIQPLHEYQEQEGVRGPIAEIGVFHGKFFIGLALTKSDQAPHLALDVFDMQRFNLDGAGKGNLEAFKENIRKAGIAEDSVRIHPTDSMALKPADLASLHDQSRPFSMFSVDGCHMVEHTINDFRIAMEMTSPGGIIFVDDYLNPDWPGVQEGLARLYLNDAPRFVPLAYTSNKLFTCHISYHKEMHAYLLDALRTRFPEDKVKVVKRFGYDCINVRPDMQGTRYTD